MTSAETTDGEPPPTRRARRRALKAQPRVDTLVAWTIERDPWWWRAATLIGRALAWVAVVITGLAQVALDAGPAILDKPRSGRPPRLPLDDNNGLDLRLAVGGDAAFLHSRWYDAFPVDLTRAGARIHPRTVEIDLPIDDLTPVRVRPVSVWRRRRSHRARWQLLCLHHAGGRVIFDGEWLALAWLGKLADWPEPPRAPGLAGVRVPRSERLKHG